MYSWHFRPGKLVAPIVEILSQEEDTLEYVPRLMKHIPNCPPENYWVIMTSLSDYYCIENECPEIKNSLEHIITDASENLRREYKYRTYSSAVRNYPQGFPAELYDLRWNDTKPNN